MFIAHLTAQLTTLQYHWVILISSCWHREGSLKVLAVPELSAPEIDSIKLDGGGYVLVYGIHGDFVQIDKGWILSVTDEELLLSLAIPTLLKPSEYVIRAGGDIRIRAEASPNAPVTGIVKGAECEALLEGYDKLGDYFRVFFNTCSKPLLMGWILSSLMEPFDGSIYRMNPNHCTGDGGVTLTVHSVPDADAPCIERVGPEDEVCVVGSSGKWRRVLSNMGPMGWILSESTMANGIFDELLVAVCRDDMSTLQQQQNVQQSATAEFPLQSVTTFQSQQSPSETISNTIMEVVSTSKLRDEPAFVGLELADLNKGTIVEIIEERDVPQKPGFPPQPWVRVRCAAGEGWTAKTNRNGALLVPSSFSKPTEVFSRNSMQQQHCQQSDDPSRTSGTSALPIAPVIIHSAEGTSGGVPPPPPRFMEVCVTAKLREEADFIGLEVAVLQQGDVVEVLDEQEIPQKPGHPPQPWVNIRCAAGEGWIAKRNRNGPILVPTTHKLQAGKAPEKNQEACGQKTHDNFTRPQHIPPQLSSSSSNTPDIHSSSTHLSADLSSKFMEVVSTAKLREDADFTGLELAVLGKGDVVEVLEEKDVPQKPGNPPQSWVRVRCGTGEGWTAKTNRNGALLIPTQKPTVRVPEQKKQPQMELNIQALDTAFSSQCSNSVHSPTMAAAPPLHVLPPTEALPCSSTFLEITVTTVKLREEPDIAGVELAVLEKGGIVEVIERKDIPQKPGRPPQPWVKVKSSCGEGWTALTNRNGPLLVPTEPNAVAVEQQKEQQPSDAALLSSSSPTPLIETSSIPQLNESLPSSQKEQKLQHLPLPAVSNTLLGTTFLAARCEEQLRQYPTSESPVVALMRAGTMARVTEDKPCGSWVKVELIGEEQPMMGWIDSQAAATSHPVSFKWIC